MNIRTNREVSFSVSGPGGEAFLDLVAHRRGVELRHVKWVNLGEADIEIVVAALRQAWQAHMEILNAGEKP